VSKRVVSEASPSPSASPTAGSGSPTGPRTTTARTQDETAPGEPTQAQASAANRSTEAEGQTGHQADDSEARTKGNKELLAQGPTICADLRKLFQAFAREPRTGPAQEAQLRDLYRKVHFLTASAGASEYAPIAQMADVFEALLFVLIEQPARIGPSVLRTIASVVDFVELLFQHARESRLSGPRSAQVLVVDDDPLSNRMVVSGLRQAQLRVRSTEDPLVAWQWLQREQFHLVLLDIEMPGLDGYELCQRLRTLPAYEKTPVIYVTGHSDFENRAKSTLSGGDDLIAKPVLPIELATKVVMHLLRNQLLAQPKTQAGTS
jgi:CheY-like chemotaxis protein